MTEESMIVQPETRRKPRLKTGLAVALVICYTAVFGFGAIFLAGLIQRDWSWVSIGAPGFFAAVFFLSIFQHQADQKGARV